MTVCVYEKTSAISNCY